MCSMVATLVEAVPRNSFKVSIDDDLLNRVREAYETDPWFKKVTFMSQRMAGVEKCGGLWYIGNRLVVSKNSGL